MAPRRLIARPRARRGDAGRGARRRAARGRRGRAVPRAGGRPPGRTRRAPRRRPGSAAQRASRAASGRPSRARIQSGRRARTSSSEKGPDGRPRSHATFTAPHSRSMSSSSEPGPRTYSGWVCGDQEDAERRRPRVGRRRDAREVQAGAEARGATRGLRRAENRGEELHGDAAGGPGTGSRAAGRPARPGSRPPARPRSAPGSIRTRSAPTSASASRSSGITEIRRMPSVSGGRSQCAEIADEPVQGTERGDDLGESGQRADDASGIQRDADPGAVRVDDEARVAVDLGGAHVRAVRRRGRPRRGRAEARPDRRRRGGAARDRGRRGSSRRLPAAERHHDGVARLRVIEHGDRRRRTASRIRATVKTSAGGPSAATRPATRSTTRSANTPARLRSCRTASTARPLALARRAQDVEHAQAVTEIEVGGRLVEQHQVAALHEAAGERGPLSLAAAQRRQRAVGERGQLGGRQRLVDRGLVLRRERAERTTPGVATQGDRVADGEREARVRLRDHAGDAPGREPSRQRPARARRRGSTSPACGSSSPEARRSSVLLPAPFGPTTATISPRATPRSTPSTTGGPA